MGSGPIRRKFSKSENHYFLDVLNNFKIFGFLFSKVFFQNLSFVFKILKKTLTHQIRPSYQIRDEAIPFRPMLSTIAPPDGTAPSSLSCAPARRIRACPSPIPGMCFLKICRLLKFEIFLGICNSQVKDRLKHENITESCRMQ